MSNSRMLEPQTRYLVQIDLRALLILMMPALFQCSNFSLSAVGTWPTLGKGALLPVGTHPESFQITRIDRAVGRYYCFESTRLFPIIYANVTHRVSPARKVSLA